MNDIWNNNTLEDEIRRNSLEYGMAVNSDRSIPDAKSGLKPVARRILYDMSRNGVLSSKPHVKSARVYGSVMGTWHPHGDSSIYGAMVRLAQSWVMRYTLIDGHGNFGNILGDGPAAGRYTEVRLAKIAEDGLLTNLKKRNVDFIPNYDETEEEPVTLPAIFPNLLCNPNDGIGWAMGCSWAPHNLREVSTAIQAYLNGEEPTLPGPDFPTGGVIINKNDIPAIMKTGHGTVRVRGRYKIEKQNIVFYEIPYGTRVEALMTEIGAACDEEKLTNIVDIRNETSKKDGLRLVIEVAKGANPEAVVLQLFNKTNLQSTFSYNQVALVGKTPTELNLKDAIKIYVNHNKDCIVRETKYDMEKAKARKEIVDGLLKALADIDAIVAIIRGSESSAAAKDALVKKYSFSEPQVKAILDMKLARLAKLEGIELEKEKTELGANLQKWALLIKDEKEQEKLIIARLTALVNKYGDERRTELTQIDIKPEEKEIVEVIPEDVIVVTTQSGLIKKVPVANFKVQKRGGKGIKSTDDAIMSTIKTNTIDYMMFFTDQGKMYRTVVDNVPTGTAATKGVSINTLVQLDPNEKVIAVTSLHRKTIPQYAIFITKQGMFKKTYLSEYLGAKRNAGIAALKLKEGDSVANVIFQDDEEMLIITKRGMSIRFETKSIGAIGRLSMGVKGVNLAEDDEVVAALPVHKLTDTVAVFTSTGVGKKVDLKEFPLQMRGGKGTQIYKLSPEVGEVIGAAMVADEDNILLTGNKSSICFSAAEIPLMSRTAVGNIMIKNNRVISVTKV